MKQITVICNPDDFVVANISTLLAQYDINIDWIDAEVVNGVGVVNLVVDHYDDAMRLLREAEYSLLSEEALVVRIEDKPGALAQIAQRFKDASIPMRSMRILRRDKDDCVVAIVVQPMDEARAIVEDILVA